MKRILFLLAGITTLAACRKGPERMAMMIDDSLKPTMQRYYVVYKPAADSTTMGANLMPEKQPANGSSFYEITDDYAVLANGMVSTPNGSRITRSWAVSGLQEVTFLYTRRGFRFENRVRPTDIGDAAFDSTAPSTISLNDTIDFTCIASPLQADEKLYMWFMKERAPGTNESWAGFGQAVQNGHIHLTPHDMQSATPGKYKMQLKRERELPLQQPDHTAGGYIYIELITEEREVVFY